jgi:pimeloyl-ACP methyl ester carboxylesterase
VRNFEGIERGPEVVEPVFAARALYGARVSADVPSREAAPLGAGRAVSGGEDLDVEGYGVRLRASRWEGRTPTILLLHGLASQRRFWNLVVPLLTDRTVITLDQRGHGDAERPPDGPYDVATAARDAAAAVEQLGIRDVLVVGHSWGASVAMTVAAQHPELVLGVVAIDGGVTSLADLGPRAEIRERLEPPRLAAPAEQLPGLFARGSLAPWWTEAHADALLPAFAVDSDGLARARLRFELHMQVLDGLLDYRAEDVLPLVCCPAWVVSCEPVPTPTVPGDPAYHDEAWRVAREHGLERAVRLLAAPRLLRWGGAVHDVPLQWPALVAGLVAAAADEAGGGPA